MEVVVKNGEGDVYVLSVKECLIFGIVLVVIVKDIFGVGDVFNVGYLVGWIKGLSVEDVVCKG